MVKEELKARRMKVTDAAVLLNYTWLILALFGPCLPLFNVLSVLLARIYFVLLFGCNLKMLVEDRNEQQSTGVINTGFSSVAFLALVLHSGNLPSRFALRS
eukprot:6488652-Amphidinium_carterae.1